LAETLTKVLVVDDEAAILDMIGFALELAGLEATTAAIAYTARL
jgi:CheY-like chemotaxis protein